MGTTVRYGCPICKDSWSEKCMTDHLETAKIQRTLHIQQLHTLDYSIKAGEHFEKNYDLKTPAEMVKSLYEGVDNVVYQLPETCARM